MLRSGSAREARLRAGAAVKIRSSAVEMLSRTISQVRLESCADLVRLADRALAAPAPDVSGVIVDGKRIGKLIEQNTLKSGRMAFLPLETEDEEIRALYRFLLYKGAEYLAHSPFEPREIELEGCWIVDQRANDYQILHAHVPNLLSGIVYLEIPACMEMSTYPDGILTLIEENPFIILPIAGHMYVWPAYMLHTVYPFRGEGRRLALSFNLRARRPEEGADAFRIPTYRQVTAAQYYGRRKPRG